MKGKQKQHVPLTSDTGYQIVRLQRSPSMQLEGLVCNSVAGVCGKALGHCSIHSGRYEPVIQGLSSMPALIPASV